MRTFAGLLLVMGLLFSPCLASASAQVAVPILLYHRFGPTVADSMTVRTAVFVRQVDYLEAHGGRVIPLRRLVDWYYGRAPAPPRGAVVIVADDGHQSVFTEMAPVVKRFHIPVTLFIYPSAISNANYAMTWGELRALKASGLFDIQSHTYWHPNFRHERRRLTPAAYARFVDVQLRRSKARLEREVGGPVDMLAWPFGIWDDDLLARAAADGYVATFTLARRPATAADRPLKLPRYLMRDSDGTAVLARILARALGVASPASNRKFEGGVQP